MPVRISFGILLVLVVFVVSGCKATATLEVKMRDNASGTVGLNLVLDDQAASALRHDAYKATSLASLFDTETLRKAGFHVDVDDKPSGKSQVKIAAAFANEKELKAILQTLAPESVVQANMSSKSAWTSEEHKIGVSVDLAKLRAMYLDDPRTKSAVEAAGITFSEFETLVNDALSATTVKVIVNDGDRIATKSSAANAATPISVRSESSVTRMRFIANWIGAIVAGLLALFLFFRLARTPRLRAGLDDIDKAQ